MSSSVDTIAPAPASDVGLMNGSSSVSPVAKVDFVGRGCGAGSGTDVG